MDGPHFDAWTRRRFGFAAGGLAASLWGMTFSRGAVAKKRRCRKLGKSCKKNGKKCCGELRCDRISFEPSPETRCCRKEGKSCEGNLDCCAQLCCPPQLGTCTSNCVSDRHLKSNFGTVDPADMLERVRSLPISTWNYTDDDPFVRHIGPMAQDFAATFGVGADDRHIHPLDGQGVALAAIQGLADRVAELREENARLAARIAELETRTEPM